MTIVTLGQLKTAEAALAALKARNVQLDLVTIAMIRDASFFQEVIQVSLGFVPVRDTNARFWQGNRNILAIYQVARKQKLSWCPSIEVGVMLALEHADHCHQDRTLVIGMKSMPFWKLASLFTVEQRRSHRAHDQVLSLMGNDRFVAQLGTNEEGVFLTGRPVEYMGKKRDSWSFIKAA